MRVTNCANLLKYAPIFLLILSSLTGCADYESINVKKLKLNNTSSSPEPTKLIASTLNENVAATTTSSINSLTNYNPNVVSAVLLVKCAASSPYSSDFNGTISTFTDSGSGIGLKIDFDPVTNNATHFYMTSDIASAATAPETDSPRFKPNQTGCSLEVKSVTVQDSSGKTANYVESDTLILYSDGTQVPAGIDAKYVLNTNAVYAANTNAVQSSSTSSQYVYINGKFSDLWTVGSPYTPVLTLSLGRKENLTASAPTVSYQNISLTSASSSVSAPNYCIGDITGCSDATKTSSQFSIKYLTNYSVTYENLSLYYDGKSTSTEGESYVFINNAYAPLDSSSSSPCGTILSDGSVNTTGCTYGLVDSVFKAVTADSATFSSKVLYPPNYNDLKLSNVKIAGSGSAYTLNWNYDLSSTTPVPPNIINADFLGLLKSSAVPVYTAQSAIIYLIIQHMDQATSIPSYQLFVLNGGHNP